MPVHPVLNVVQVEALLYMELHVHSVPFFLSPHVGEGKGKVGTRKVERSEGNGEGGDVEDVEDV